MKKKINLLSLVILVSVNVLTPFSYAQFDEPVEILQGENLSLEIQNSGDKLPSQWIEGVDFYPITVSDGEREFTIMDRNLGATGVSNGERQDSTQNTVGYFYQWGNNYGFSKYDTQHSQISSSQVDASAYGPNNPYYSSTWIDIFGGRDSSDNNNLWGGSGDIQILVGWSSGNIGSDEDRQGPCPVGYHVPSQYQWEKIYEIRGSENSEIKYIGNTTQARAGNKGSSLKDFLYDLKMPSDCGRLSQRVGYYYCQQSSSGVGYWSSTHDVGKDPYAMYLSVWEENISSNIAGYTSYGNHVRCVKNSHTKILNYVYNGGSSTYTNPTETAPRWMDEIELSTYENTTKIGGDFGGRYRDINDESTRVVTNYILDDTDNDSITLYAKWEPHPKIRFLDGDDVIVDEEEYRHWCGDTDYGYPVCEPNLQYDEKFSGYISQKEGQIFKGWYTDKDLTEKFDFDNATIEGDLDLYAKWEYCGDGYKVINNKCVLGDAGVYYENGYIKVTDGERTKYLKDRNVGADNDIAVKMLIFGSQIGQECNEIDNLRSCIENEGLGILNDIFRTDYSDFYAGYLDIILGGLKLEGLSDDEIKLAKLVLLMENSSEMMCGDSDNPETCTIDFVNTYLPASFENADEIEIYAGNLVSNLGENSVKKTFRLLDSLMRGGLAGGNYYYRGNNNGIKYSDLELDDNNGIITNMETLEKKGFTGGRLGEPDTGWEKDSGLENPCNGEGEYLPSREDWLELMTLYGDINGYEMKDYSCSDDGENYECYGSGLAGNGGDLFVNDMLIPDGYIYYSWDGNNYYSDDAYLWTASTGGYVGEMDYSWLYYMTPENMRDYRWDYGNKVAMPVRCFVDEEYVETLSGVPSYTVTFKDGDEELFTKKVKEGKLLKNVQDPDPAEEGYIFEGWYTSTDGGQTLSDEAFDLDTPIKQNIILYAKWKEYGVLYKDGYIKITNGADSVYIKDVNQGVSEDFMVKLNQIRLLQDEMCHYERYVPAESLSLHISSDGSYVLTCPDNYNTEVGKIIGIENPEDWEIDDFIRDNSRGNFYFRGNNSGVNYDDLEFDDNNITNVDYLIKSGFSGGYLGDSDKEWKAGNPNPCNGEGEYLPTVSDWIDAIELWSELKGYGTESYDYDYLETDSLKDYGWIDYNHEFLDDIMVYDGQGYIYKSYYSPEDYNLYFYDYYRYMWASLDRENIIGSLGDSLRYDKINDYFVNYGDYNNYAYPVRCFMHIDEPEDDEPTTPTTPTYTPSYGGGGGGGRTGVTKTDEGKTHGSATEEEKQDTEVKQEDSKEKEDTQKEAQEAQLPWQNVTDTTTQNDTHGSATTTSTTPTVSYTQEFKNAYSFAKANGITTKSTIQDAKMYTELTRIQMAKMLSQYAINVLGQTPDYSRGVVKFNDVSNKLNSEYDDAVTLAYQLGIMGVNMKNNNFRPRDTVTRAEFATALSRMLYGLEDGKGKTKYYEPHIAKLYNEGIISNTNAKMVEKRGYVMTMLMRTVR